MFNGTLERFNILCDEKAKQLSVKDKIKEFLLDNVGFTITTEAAEQAFKEKAFKNGVNQEESEFLLQMLYAIGVDAKHDICDKNECCENCNSIKLYMSLGVVDGYSCKKINEYCLDKFSKKITEARIQYATSKKN